jgi:PIN domain nuclease of toxin-antitoxin system
MRLLLDTHTLLWLIGDDARLGDQAREIILDPKNVVFVSIVSFWEIGVKLRIGKLGPINLEEVMAAVTSHGLELLPLEPHHITTLLKLPLFLDHRDPFDHQLIAQAIAESLIFVTQDSNAHRYPVQRISCSNQPTASP